MAETLKQLREKLDAKSAQLREVFTKSKIDAGSGEFTYDFQQADADWLGADTLALTGTAKSMAVIEQVTARTAELSALQDRVTKQEEAEGAGKALAKRDATPVNRPGHPETKNQGEQKSFGQLVTEHDVYKRWQKGDMGGKIVLDMGMAELKTLFQTSAGWAPESTRTGTVVPAVTRPLQVTDIMPTGRTGMANVVYMEETTRTHSAAEKAEGAAYAESTFVLTERTSAVRKITDSVPVTDEQLEDVAMVQSYLEGRLNFGVQQRLDGQIIAGDGIAPNLEGIVNVTGIQTLANAAEPVPDTIFNMMKLIRVTGRAMPTHVLLHPNDWAPIRLLRTADGLYIWGNPSEQGPERIWGLPVVQNESLTENTGLVGSFLLPWITVFERRGIVVERGFVGDQFKEGKQTIRASGRWAQVVYRPAAFGTVTNI
jgi:HK97 family phage major capsid protein